MNKVENINLGGQVFIIDQDAYKGLNRYIDNIARVLKKTKYKADLLDDIEIRMAELIEENLQGRKIVSLKDVNFVQKTMGDPKVFSNDDDSVKFEEEEQERPNNIRRRKRLFRNEDDKVFGGVASGMAAYFGIKEPWLMRILFLFTFFSLGLNVILYILLWIIMPAAITDEDYREMYGEPVDFGDIADSVKTEFESLKRSFTD